MLTQSHIQTLFDALLVEADEAATLGEVPVAACVWHAQLGVIGRAINATERDADPTAHAEIIAIRQACQHMATPRLVDCALLVTLEPCTMCAAAISFARIHTLVYGAYDPKGGGVEHGSRFYHQPTCHHRPDIIAGIQEQACGAMLQHFFQARRVTGKA